MTVPAVEPAHCWPIDTSCLGEVWDSYSPEVKARAELLAVETLRMLTAYRVGGCPITVRPCRKPCLPSPTWAVYPAPGANGGWSPVVGWHPGLLSGTWVNVACGCHFGECSCGPLCELDFPEGIASVTEVLQDGAVLDPTAYRIDNGTRLLRTDGDCWLVCQDMTKPLTGDDSANTLGITYTVGSLPGPLGAIAAGTLAGEYAKACVGASCALPPRATKVARTGVTIDLATDTGDAWPSGMTGIREVDLFIRRLNPYALRTPSAVWSPDVRRPRRVWP